MTNDIISLVANVALALSFIVGLVFGIAQVRAAARDRRDRLTIEALRNFQSRDFAELLQYVVAHEIPSSREELQTLPISEQILFMQLAQQMEMLGILVAEKFIDIDLVDKTIGSFVFTAWEKYKKMAFSQREVDPFLNEYFQWLAERISERMAKNPRKPFHETNTRLP
ncbi:MAG: hypothetical protein ABSG17_21515 [Spirochaetia bacterium]|jgi:hypothetical protein